MRRILRLGTICMVLSLTLAACASMDTTNSQKNDEQATAKEEEKDDHNKKEKEKEKQEKQAKKKSELEFDKPDAVLGIYLTGHSAGGDRFDTLLDLVDDTDLNSMVIDIKDDAGNLTYEPDKESDLASFGKPYIKNPEKIVKKLQKHDIYPIARIVVFKDSVLAEKEPNLSFLSGDEVWENGKGDLFVSPFQKEVWEHNLDIAKEAAEMGFQEIQFDYVRFPEGFEDRADELSYDKGDYEATDDDVEARVQAVTDFVAKAEDELDDYDVDVGVDIFGYTAAVPNAPGIGQDLVKIGEHIDVLSSMIYPSHWGPGSLDIDKPDLEPYDVIFNYADKEKEKLFRMDDPPTSRPWIQDFTASWLGEGNYKTYGTKEIEAQIRALNESGIDEYLLWNANNSYTENVDYTPSLDDKALKKVKKKDKKLREEIEEEQEEEKNANKDNEKSEAEQKEKTDKKESKESSS